MEYQITVTEEDYVQFNVFHSQQRAMAGSIKRIVLLYLIGFLTCLAISIVSREFMLGAMIFLLVACGLSVLLLRSTKLITFLVRRNVRKLGKSGKLPYTPSAKLVFQEDQILWEYDRGVINIPYADVEDVCQYQNALYIYTGVQQALLIPEACLGGDTEKVIRYLAEKTGKYPSC